MNFQSIYSLIQLINNNTRGDKLPNYIYFVEHFAPFLRHGIWDCDLDRFLFYIYVIIIFKCTNLKNKMKSLISRKFDFSAELVLIVPIKIILLISRLTENTGIPVEGEHPTSEKETRNGFVNIKLIVELMTLEKLLSASRALDTCDLNHQNFG